MVNRRRPRRRAKRKTRRHYGMGLKDVLAAGVKLGVRLGRDKRYKRPLQRTSKTLGSMKNIKRNLPFINFSSSQSLQETRHVEACQQGSDQRRQ